MLDMTDPNLYDNPKMKSLFLLSLSLDISLGEVCNGECECFDPNSECDENIHVCLCVDGFYDSNGLQPEGTCLPCKVTSYVHVI